MKISKNTVVTLTYKLKVDGELIEQGNQDNPLVYLSGVGAMIPGFEGQLEGKAEGDHYNIMVQPSEGYGEYNQGAVVNLPMSTFEIEGKVDEEMLQVGNVLPMQDDEGNPLDGKVVDIKEDEVKLDFNHPLAGKVLEFEGEIINLREASLEEIDHGHVHGPGGVEH